MGWSYCRGWDKARVIDELLKEDGYGVDEKTGVKRIGKTLAHSLRGNVLWAVVEISDITTGLNPVRFIACHLIGSQRGYGWGYKSMEESSGPYYWNCPLKFLDMVPCPDNEHARNWRLAVRAKVNRTAKEPPMTITKEVPVTSLLPAQLPEGSRIGLNDIPEGTIIGGLDETARA